LDKHSVVLKFKQSSYTFETRETFKDTQNWAANSKRLGQLPRTIDWQIRIRHASCLVSDVLLFCEMTCVCVFLVASISNRRWETTASRTDKP